MTKFSMDGSQSSESSETMLELVDRLADLIAEADDQQLENFLQSQAAYADRLRELIPALQAVQELKNSHVANSRPAERDAYSSHAGTIGDFRILREVGRGGMGVVYEARQISLDRRVALKVLPFAGALDPRRQRRFQLEAMAAAQLRHSGIVGVHSVGCDRGVHYYSMEFVDGRTLADMIAGARLEKCGINQSDAGRKSNPEAVSSTHAHKSDTELMAHTSTVPSSDHTARFRRAAEIILQIAEAISYAHSVGIVHRDVKPSNILLDAKGTALITDFGLAQIAKGSESLTLTGDLLGTLRYMSPEQAQGGRIVDERADIYSLGITLYELLSLEPAFPEADRACLLRQVCDSDPRQLREIDFTIPYDLETIVCKAISKSPDERYSTMEAFAEDLRRFLAHKPVNARRPSWGDRLTKCARRHRGIVISSAVLCLLLMMVMSASAVWVLIERNQRVQAQQARQFEATLAETKLEQERQQKQQEQRERILQTALAEQGAENTRVHRYVSDIQLAWQTWSLGKLSDMQRHLSNCIPQDNETDLRSWEWHYLWDLCRNLPSELGKHNGQAYFIALSEDETLLASCGQDGIRLWDTHSLKPVRFLDAHTDEVNWVSFSRDGKLLASASDDRNVKIWRTDSWSVVETIPFDHVILGAEFTPDNQKIIVVERGWEVAENRISIVSTKTWRPVSAWQAQGPQIEGMAISSDSKLLATVGNDRKCVIWDIENSVDPKVAQTQSAAVINCVAFLPGQNEVVYATHEGDLFRWDFSDDRLSSIRAHLGAINGLSIRKRSMNDVQLTTTCRAGEVKVWEVNNKGLTDTNVVDKHLYSTGLRWAVTSSNGRTFIAGIDGVISVFNHLVAAPLKIQISNPPDDTKAVARFIGNGDQIVIGKHGVDVFDTHSGSYVAELLPPIFTDHSGMDIGISHEGSVIAARAPQEDLYLWTAPSFDLLLQFDAEQVLGESLTPCSGPIDFSVDDQSLYCFLNNQQRQIQVDIKSSEILEIPKASQRFCCSPDGKYFMQHDGQLYLNRLDNEPKPIFLPGSHGDFVWSRDSEKVATVTWDGFVFIWETMNWNEIARFHPDPQGASDIDFSSDGRTVAVTGAEGEIHLWNISTQRKLYSLHVDAPRRGAIRSEFSRNGRSLCAMSLSGTNECIIWNADVHE